MTLTKNTEILRAEVAAHINADALVRGSYWKPSENAVGGQGCFISCLTHSNGPTPAFERFGLPVAVLRIAESIFEALPDSEGRAFFAALPDAVGRDGKDLSRVHWGFLAAELRVMPQTTDAAQAVIDPVIDGLDLLFSGQQWPDARAAADAAGAAGAADAAYAAYVADAADAAYAAADAAFAAYVADAADAAYAAYAAARAAATAADAAADASYAASRAAARVAATAAKAAKDTGRARNRQRDTLLALIAAA
jgi:hypothetical protein